MQIQYIDAGMPATVLQADMAMKASGFTFPGDVRPH